MLVASRGEGLVGPPGAHVREVRAEDPLRDGCRAEQMTTERNRNVVLIKRLLLLSAAVAVVVGLVWLGVLLMRDRGTPTPVPVEVTHPTATTAAQPPELDPLAAIEITPSPDSTGPSRRLVSYPE